MESRIETRHESQPVKKESADSLQSKRPADSLQVEKPAGALQAAKPADALKTEKWDSRTALLLGEEGVEQLRQAKVAVFGVGGVGGFVVEALARCGVGAFVLVDNDTVCLSNLNRQIIATTKTIGRDKVEVMRERILEINPQAQVEVRKCFFLPETAGEFDFSDYSYVVDAVDTVTAKLEIILRAQAAGVPVISSMGAGNKLDPTAFCVADIYQTSMCPLAKVMRRELKKRGVKKLKVVYSKEPPIKPQSGREGQNAAADRSGYEDKSECTMQIMTGFGSAKEAQMASGQERAEKARAAARRESAKKAQRAAGQECAKEAQMAVAQECVEEVRTATRSGRAEEGQRQAEPALAETVTAPEHVHALRSTPGSVAFVPSVAGLIVASEVVKDLLSET